MLLQTIKRVIKYWHTEGEKRIQLFLESNHSLLQPIRTLWGPGLGAHTISCGVESGAAGGLAKVGTAIEPPRGGRHGSCLRVVQAQPLGVDTMTLSSSGSCGPGPTSEKSEKKKKSQKRGIRDGRRLSSFPRLRTQGRSAAVTWLLGRSDSSVPRVGRPQGLGRLAAEPPIWATPLLKPVGTQGRHSEARLQSFCPGDAVHTACCRPRVKPVPSHGCPACFTIWVLSHWDRRMIRGHELGPVFMGQGLPGHPDFHRSG